jgi:hypothetical protein
LISIKFDIFDDPPGYFIIIHKLLGDIDQMMNIFPAIGNHPYINLNLPVIDLMKVNIFQYIMNNEFLCEKIGSKITTIPIKLHYIFSIDRDIKNFKNPVKLKENTLFENNKLKLVFKIIKDFETILSKDEFVHKLLHHHHYACGCSRNIATQFIINELMGKDGEWVSIDDDDDISRCIRWKYQLMMANSEFDEIIFPFHICNFSEYRFAKSGFQRSIYKLKCLKCYSCPFLYLHQDVFAKRYQHGYRMFNTGEDYVSSVYLRALGRSVRSKEKDCSDLIKTLNDRRHCDRYNFKTLADYKHYTSDMSLLMHDDMVVLTYVCKNDEFEDFYCFASIQHNSPQPRRIARIVKSKVKYNYLWYDPDDWNAMMLKSPLVACF